MTIDDYGLEVIRKAARISSKNEYYLATGSQAYSSAFGDSLSESFEPIVQINAQYGIDTENIETFSATGGTTTESDAMFVCQTGTSIGGYGVIRSKFPTFYREGQGLTARFTAVFNPSNAVVNSLQMAGLFNVQDSVCIGYRGTQKAIVYDTYGKQEIQKLEITVAGNGTLTVTLNSVNYSVPITTGTTAHNAYEIFAWFTANQSEWDCEQISNTVVFRNRNAAVKGGTYSVSGAGLTGAFTRLNQGVAKTEVTILESEWNGEPMDLDFSKGNVFQIKIAYLGFGPITFYVLCPIDGYFKLLHKINYQNLNTKPNLSNRALKIGWVAASLGSSTNITVKGACAATFIDGLSKNARHIHSQSNNNTVSTAHQSILTIKSNLTLNNKANLGRVIPYRLSVASDSTKQTSFTIVKNATLTETNFAYHDSNESVVTYDNTLVSLNASDHRLYTGQVGTGGAIEIDLKELNISILAGETLTIFARVISGASSNVAVSIIWKEDL